MIVNSPSCDWLTLTTFQESELLKIRNLFIPLVGGLAGKQAKVLQYKGQQYKGGFIGVSDQNKRTHYMARFSGEMADDVMGAIVESENCIGDCTRVDLQITVPLPKDYNSLLLFNELKKGEWSGRERSVTAIMSGDGLDTVYVGKRTSDRYIRVYVKEGASGERYLRFEVEYKGDRAKNVYTKLCLGGRRTAGGILFGEFVGLPECKEPGMVAIGCRLREYTYTSSAVERIVEPSSTMQWINLQVSPAVYRLINDSEQGDEIGKIILEWFEAAAEKDRIPNLHD